jgi:hypothetical protein
MSGIHLASMQAKQAAAPATFTGAQQAGVEAFISQGKQLAGNVNTLSEKANTSGNKALTLVMDQLLKAHTTFYDLSTKKTTTGTLYTPAGETVGQIAGQENMVFTGGNVTKQAAMTILDNVAAEVAKTGTGAVTPEDVAILTNLLNTLKKQSNINGTASSPSMSITDVGDITKEFGKKFSTQIDDPATQAENTGINNRNAIIEAGNQALQALGNPVMKEFTAWLNSSEVPNGTKPSREFVESKLNEFKDKYADANMDDWSSLVKESDAENLQKAIKGIAIKKDLKNPGNISNWVNTALKDWTP